MRDIGGLLTDAYDPNATVLRGAGRYSRIAKQAGNFLWELGLNARTPGFENNDLGLLTRTDYIWTNANILYQWTNPNRYQRQSSITFGGQTQRNFDGDLTDRQMQLALSTTTPQFWNVFFFYIARPAMLDERLTRGGPWWKSPAPAVWSSMCAPILTSCSRCRLRRGYSWNEKGGWGENDSVSARYRSSGNVNVSFGPSWNGSHSLLQYVTRKSDASATLFDGNRYIFASIDQKQLALDTRLSVTFTPTMSLEVFAQPLLASGHYLDFKDFNAPRQGVFGVFGKDRATVSTALTSSGQVATYTIDPDGVGAAAPFTRNNPDFTLRSLRGNAVFRWEVKPGSVVYVAWTHSRSGSDQSGDFGRDRTALFSTQPDNIFLVKASWWYAR